MFVEQRDNPFIFPAGIFYVDRFTYLCSGTQTLSKVACKQRMRPQPIILIARNDSRKTNHVGVNKIRSGLDQMSSRCLNTPDRILDTGKCAKPMRRMS
jgi:hypothetical protein